jgi:hypothetical protein
MWDVHWATCALQHADLESAGTVPGDLALTRTFGPDEFGPDEFGPDEFGPDEFGPDEFGPDEEVISCGKSRQARPQ